MKKNIETLIEEFIKQVYISSEKFDYTDKVARKKHNDAIRKYRAIAQNIAQGSTEVCEEFMQLLKNPSEDVAVACAVCIIELMPHTPKQYAMAVARIEKFVETSNNQELVLGFEFYLKDLKR